MKGFITVTDSIGIVYIRAAAINAVGHLETEKGQVNFAWIGKEGYCVKETVGEVLQKIEEARPE